MLGPGIKEAAIGALAALAFRPPSRWRYYRRDCGILARARSVARDCDESRLHLSISSVHPIRVESLEITCAVVSILNCVMETSMVDSTIMRQRRLAAPHFLIAAVYKISVCCDRRKE
jgi:hypothetical protein